MSQPSPQPSPASRPTSPTIAEPWQSRAGHLSIRPDWCPAAPGAGRRRAPGLAAFAERHDHDERPSWLRVALGALCFGGGVAWFVHLLRGVLADGKVVTADRCLHNTVVGFDSAALTHFYSVVSTLASVAFAGPLVLGLGAVWWAAGRRRATPGPAPALRPPVAPTNVLTALRSRPRPLGAQAR